MLCRETPEASCLQVTMDLQSSTSEQGTAAVVDGSRLLVTPLRIAAVPPPLSAVTLEAQAPVVCIGHRHGGYAEARPALHPLNVIFTLQFSSCRQEALQ